MRCFPDRLLDTICDEALAGVRAIGCRIAGPTTADPVYRLLNAAWVAFWRDPAGYAGWESKAVDDLFVRVAACVWMVKTRRCGVNRGGRPLGATIPGGRPPALILDTWIVRLFDGLDPTERIVRGVGLDQSFWSRPGTTRRPAVWGGFA